jgi:hypothetical protein
MIVDEARKTLMMAHYLRDRPSTELVERAQEPRRDG